MLLIYGPYLLPVQCRKIVRGIIGDARKLRAIIEERELREDEKVEGAEKDEGKEKEEKKKKKKTKKRKKYRKQSLWSAIALFVKFTSTTFC